MRKEKLVIVLRGSNWHRKIHPYSEASSHGVVSTVDNYFLNDDAAYDFKSWGPLRLVYGSSFVEFCQKVAIVDNTNTQRWEYEDYGLRTSNVQILRIQKCSTHDYLLLAQRNVHDKTTIDGSVHGSTDDLRECDPHLPV